MIENPYNLIDTRLVRLESLLQEVLSNQLESKVTNIPDVMTLEQAVEFTGYAKQTLYGKVSRREIPYMKKGGKLWFSREELTDWIKDGKKSTLDDQVSSMVASISNKSKRRA